MRAEIAVFVLNLSDIIILRTAPHTVALNRTVEQRLLGLGTQEQWVGGWAVFPLRKFYTEKGLFCCTVSACNCATMQTHNQWNLPSVKRLCDIYHSIWNVWSARERDSTAQVVWCYCAFAHLRGNTADGH